MSRAEAPGRIEEVVQLDTPFLVIGQKDDFGTSMVVLRLDPQTGERIGTVGRVDYDPLDVTYRYKPVDWADLSLMEEVVGIVEERIR